jgi:hypothetical protein
MNKIAYFQAFGIAYECGASDRKNLFFAQLSGLTHPTRDKIHNLYLIDFVNA